MSIIQLDQIVKQTPKRTDGFVNYGQRPDNTFYQIPVIIIDGESPGPTLLIDCCTHGDEYEGTAAILKLAGEFENKKFNGKLVLVPALNIEAFVTMRRSTLSDEFNLNRIFPGNDHSYITHRLAHVYIERVVCCADAVITFHGGGKVLHLEPIIGYLPPTDDINQKSYEMAQAFNCKYTWRMQNLPFTGVSIVEYKKKYNIPCILPEVGSHCGRLHDYNKNVDICYNGSKNVMGYLNMIPDTGAEKVKDMMDVELNYLHCYNGGMQTLVKRENDIVEEGETMAYMQDIFGNVIEELKAPYKGVVIGFWSVPVIRPGDWWSLYAKIL
ncbi:MAG: M14 family metallopeptidase [Defluviitaleaceae bacterium]|nr:M14 family metallopeptidase [Defluviitaleaceae bacterium]